MKHMVRYLLGHRIDKHFAPGHVYFTIDGGHRRFDTSADAVAYIRWAEAASNASPAALCVRVPVASPRQRDYVQRQRSARPRCHGRWSVRPSRP